MGDLAALEAAMAGRRGSARLRPLWSLVDGRAESPLETWARLRCIDEGLPPDELQVMLRASNGEFLARGDMGWRRDDGGWVVVEMDGRDVHSSPEAVFADRERQNRLLVEAKVTLLRFTGQDLGHRSAIPMAVRRALAQSKVI